MRAWSGTWSKAVSSSRLPLDKPVGCGNRGNLNYADENIPMDRLECIRELFDSKRDGARADFVDQARCELRNDGR